MLESFRNFLINLAEQGDIPSSFRYGFVINAMICALLIGPILGGIGTMVVTKKMAFFSEAVGHAAMTGIAVGVLLGEPFSAPYISLFTYCILFGLVINYTKNRTKMSSDTLIGVFLSISIALGGSLLIYVSAKVNSHALESILFGSILTVNDTDIYILVISAIVITVTIIIKIYSINFTFTPLTIARFGLKLANNILFRYGTNTKPIIIADTTKMYISVSFTVSIEPNNILSKACEFTLADT